jgi:hypothetical protein
MVDVFEDINAEETAQREAWHRMPNKFMRDNRRTLTRTYGMAESSL